MERIMKRTHATAMILIALASLASAAAAQAPDPAFLKHFHKEHTTLLVVHDPLPWLKDLLTDARLRKIFREGELGRQLMRQMGKAIDPAESWTLVNTNSHFIPREIVMGTTDSALADLDHLVRFGILIGLCHGARESNSQKELAALRQQTLEELRLLKVPSMRIWVRLRRGHDAAPLAAMAKDGMAAMAARLGIAGREIPGGVEYSLNVGQMMDAEGRFVVLNELGLADQENDPLVKPMSDALAAVALYVRMEHAGDGLHLTFGSAPPGKAPPMAQADLGQTYSTSAGQILWARWDIARLKQASKGWIKLWRAWEDTPTGKRLVADDDEDLLGTLSIVDRQLQRYADSGAMRIWAEKGVNLLMNEIGAPPAESLAASRVFAAVPPRAEAMGATTIYSLGDDLSNALARVEDRLATSSLRAEIKGQQDQVNLYERLGRFFYRDLARFRELIHKSSIEQFDRDVAWVLATRGVVKKFEVKFGQEGLSGADLPAIEFAVIGRARDVRKARQFVDDAYSAFVAGVSRRLRITVPRQDRRVRERDLGIGAQTWGFDASWIEKAETGRLSIEGDATPHFFFIDDLFIFSTSPRLSREIIAASRQTQRAALPAGKVVSFGRIPGSAIGASVDIAAKWATGVTYTRANPIIRQNLEEGSRMLGGISELARLIDVIEWHSFDEDKTRITRGKVSFIEIK
jgi:hypothetical protein